MAGKIKFAKKTTTEARQSRPWRVLIVDDDTEIHAVTKLALKGVSYKGRVLEFVDAYSTAEAMGILEGGDAEFSLVLLDVVMESDDAGLNLVSYIREALNNRRVRIILRTGQPGQAPEREVIVGYDINDYKAKTELTQEKLFTTVISALRSYEDIMALETNRRGLERIIEASSSLFRERSLRLFASGVLTQVSALLGCDEDAILTICNRDEQTGSPGRLQVMAAAGRYTDLVGQDISADLDPAVAMVVRTTLERGESQYGPGYTCLYIRTPTDREVAVYVRIGQPLSSLDIRLLGVLCSNISIGLDNLQMYESLATLNRNLEMLVAERTGQLAERTRESESATRRFRGILEQAYDAVISIDSDRTITLFNPAAERTFGFTADEMIGQPLNALLPEDVRGFHEDKIAAFLASSDTARALSRPVRARRRDGSCFPAEISVSRLDLPGQMVLTAVIRDVTEHYALQEKLRELATTDPLTGIFNRRHFMEIAETEFERARRIGAPVAVAMIDADYFKRVNDSYGHATGDTVLRQIAELSRTQLRRADVIARYGGEEFVILLPGAGPEEARQIAERLRSAVATQPMTDGRVTFRCSVSVGIAVAQDPQRTLERTLAAADAALYAAKAGGRNRVELAP